jgi:hypothetical protein
MLPGRDLNLAQAPFLEIERFHFLRNADSGDRFN